MAATAHELGSWLILSTYLATSGYLLYEARRFSPLIVIACLAVAMILCFVGFLFTGAVTYILQMVGLQPDNELILAVLVVVGVLIGLLIRHLWKKYPL